MYFSWIRSAGWSGKARPVISNKPWDAETKMRADWTPVLFSVELKKEEEHLTIAELSVKYPRPE